MSFAGGSSRIEALVPGDPPPQGEIDARCLSERNEIYKGTPYQASARAWKPDSAVWAAIKRHSVAGPATITFFGYREGDPLRVLSRGRVTIGTSLDPVGAPIFYRDVPLMPAQTEQGVIKPLAQASLPLINWRLRDIARPESRLMLTDMPTCANCHSFSGDGRTMGMDIDGPQGDKGAYAIAPVKKRMVITYREVMTWNAFKEKTQGLNTLGFLSRMSPDGQFVVSTVNEELYVQNFWDYKINQVFYPTRGILAFFSRATGEITALPGADDPEYVHCNPVWSPDGRTIVFARAGARDAYITGRPPAPYAGDPHELVDDVAYTLDPETVAATDLKGVGQRVPDGGQFVQEGPSLSQRTVRLRTDQAITPRVDPREQAQQHDGLAAPGRRQGHGQHR